MLIEHASWLYSVGYQFDVGLMEQTILAAIYLGCLWGSGQWQERWKTWCMPSNETESERNFILTYITFMISGKLTSSRLTLIYILQHKKFFFFSLSLSLFSLGWPLVSVRCKCRGLLFHLITLNTFAAIVDLSRFNNSWLKSPASTLVDLTFQSRALRSFSLNQLRNLSL